MCNGTPVSMFQGIKRAKRLIGIEFGRRFLALEELNVRDGTKAEKWFNLELLDESTT
jgi:hypothetical protein